MEEGRGGNGPLLSMMQVFLKMSTDKQHSSDLRVPGPYQIY